MGEKIQCVEKIIPVSLKIRQIFFFQWSDGRGDHPEGINIPSIGFHPIIQVRTGGNAGVSYISYKVFLFYFNPFPDASGEVGKVSVGGEETVGMANLHNFSKAPFPAGKMTAPSPEATTGVPTGAA